MFGNTTYKIWVISSYNIIYCFQFGKALINKKRNIFLWIFITGGGDFNPISITKCVFAKDVQNGLIHTKKFEFFIIDH